MTKSELDQIIRLKIRSGVPVREVGGAISDRGDLAFIEEEGVNENGRYTKFYGVKQLYKGWIVDAVIDRVATVKRVWMESFKLAGQNPAILLSGKKLIAFFSRVYDADLKKHEPKVFTRQVREFVRAMPYQTDEERNCVMSLAMFLEFDKAYWMRFIDLFSIMDAVALKVNPIRELNRAFQIAMTRERGIVEKFDKMARLMPIALKVPFVRRRIERFLWEVDLNEMRVDGDDVYFMYDRKQYDYLGIPYETRREMKRAIDVVSGNVLFTE